MAGGIFEGICGVTAEALHAQRRIQPSRLSFVMAMALRKRRSAQTAAPRALELPASVARDAAPVERRPQF
jgi:hypothetical protein